MSLLFRMKVAWSTFRTGQKKIHDSVLFEKIFSVLATLLIATILKLNAGTWSESESAQKRRLLHLTLNLKRFLFQTTLPIGHCHWWMDCCVSFIRVWVVKSTQQCDGLFNSMSHAMMEKG